MDRPKIQPLLAAASVAVFLIFCGGWAWFGANFPQTGWDASQFYIAGSIPFEDLYDREAYEAFAAENLVPLGVEYFPPYVRPAVFALPLKALSLLPYPAALGVFFAVQFAFFCATLYLLLRRFGLPVDLLPVFGLFYPAMMGIITGQDPHTLTLLALAGFLLLERGRDVAGGIVWGLCLYKFNLILWLPLLLLVKGRTKALASMAGTGAALAATSILLAPPGEYLALLRNIESYTIDFSAGKMIGIRGLSVVAGAEAIYPFVAGALLLAGVVPLRRLPLERAFALALTGSMLCSYHVNWYDGVLLLPVLALILASGPAPGKFLAVGLLVFFPLWVKTAWIAFAIVVLWAIQAWPAFWPSCTAKFAGSGEAAAGGALPH